MLPRGSGAMNGLCGGRSAATGAGVATVPTKAGELWGSGSVGIGTACVDAAAAAPTSEAAVTTDATRATRRRGMHDQRRGAARVPPYGGPSDRSTVRR